MIRTTPNLNVFAGETAVRDFLDPEKNLPLPLVELPQSLNPFAEKKVRIFAKLMHFLPLGNVKYLPAYNMLLEKETSEGAANITHLIENSSGNTVFSLAVLGKIFGISHTKAIVSHEVTWGKLQLLRFFGTEIMVNQEPICPDPRDKTSGIHKAKKIGRRKGWFNPGQYDNEANPGAHEKWTGPQIWSQTQGEISVLAVGLGTTGTAVGVGRFLKNKSSNVAVLGVTRKPNNPVPGVRTPTLLKEIAFNWEEVVDAVEEIGTKESFETSLNLCRSGLMAGPSSGFTLAGLLQFIANHTSAGTLDSLRNKKGEVHCVFICPDSPLPYVDEYFKYLDPKLFPKIQNEELLINKPLRGKPKIEAKERSSQSIRSLEISPGDALRLVYGQSSEEIWSKIGQNQKITLQRGIKIIDVRRQSDFRHFHIPRAKNKDFYSVARGMNALNKKNKDNVFIFVCEMGNRSKVLAQIASEHGVRGLSLQGGVTEWSRLNLPRIRPDICMPKVGL